MASLFSGGGRRTAHINGRPIDVESGETLLAAALRQDIAFPHSCRVGGCATCKCRLVSGEVKELTETGYILSDDELDRGFILACQSTPRSDVAIEVALAAETVGRSVHGRIVGRTALTRDIVRLDVQLDEPLAYRAGQFATLTLASLPGESRSYSFATAPNDDERVAFFVRKVPGGVFSGRIHDGDVVGEEIRVDGPAGDFWMRPGDEPVVLVAGGSGLAPILAMLEELERSGGARPVTLLFGAREERDLYGLDRIRAMAARWPASFDFVPVLSEAGPRSTWSGERGLVTDVVPRHLGEATSAYLCGPPAMVDAAVRVLTTRGISSAEIHADRFTTRAIPASPRNAALAAAGADRSPVAGPIDYLKFFLFHAVGLVALAAFLGGGAWISLGFATVLGFYVIGDALLGNDTAVPHFTHPGILTAQLWMALPLLLLFVFCALWGVSPGDPLDFGAALSPWLGWDLVAAKAATTGGHLVSAVLMAGLLIGLIGTIAGHELTHRTWDPVSLVIGRWLLAFSFDTSFAIEHVYGHHRYVSTELDPATAPRGRLVYHHIVASTLEGNRSAWAIETKRLQRKHLGLWSWHNAFLRGQVMSLALLVAAWGIGGWRAAAFLLASGLFAKSLLEIVNYMEHYGMVRDPAKPVEPRHSWNTNKRISSWSMFNLTRHSHHHAQGEVPYQDLMPFPEAPMMINGYLTTMIVTLIPPLWHRLMIPKVIAWDRDYATPDERRLAARANAASGIAAFERSNPMAIPAE